MTTTDIVANKVIAKKFWLDFRFDSFVDLPAVQPTSPHLE